MKRILSIFLSLVLSLGSLSTVFAADETTKQQQVLEKIKGRIGDTERYENFTADSYNNIYGFSWENEGESLYVTATEDGFITDYSYYNNMDTEDGPKIVDLAEAKTNAKNIVNALNPGFEFTLESSSSSRGGTPSFFIQRTEKGIPVDGDTGYIELEAEGWGLSNFYITYTPDLGFSDAKSVISKEEAEKIYMEKLGLKLVYKPVYKDGERQFVLAYDAKENNKYVNAVTGGIFDYQQSLENYKNEGVSMGAGATADAAESEALTEREKEEFDKIAGLKSTEELDKALRAIKILGIDDTYTLESTSLYYDDYNKRYYGTLGYENKDKDKGGISVTVDPSNGDILIFSTYGGEAETTENVISKEEAAKKAQEVFNALAGERGKEYKLNEASTDKYGSWTDFIRYKDGAECTMDSGYVSFDSSGNLKYFSISYSYGDFPSVSSAITFDEAAKIIFENMPYRVVYMADYGTKKFVPVYGFERENIALNAVTGEFINKITTVEDDLFTYYYKDIDNSYAKDMIITLAQYGVYFEDTNFRPTEAITQKDFVAMLYCAIRGTGAPINDDTYEEAYEYLQRRGIIDLSEIVFNMADNPPIRREQAAELIIRMLGYEDIAKLDIYAPQFSDVTEDIGYSSLLKGLGIMQGAGDGKFNPKGSITRQDAAVIIYKALSI